MRYVISENRLERIFKNFMDSQYDLTYDSKPREFLGKDGEVFGFVALKSMKHTSKHFYYGDYKTEYFLNEMFGELTNELLLHYFRERFPDLKIDGIE
jgi:spore coat polysaccharide biosynthesis protein SpsF (cytidylyltransferase family)